MRCTQYAHFQQLAILLFMLMIAFHASKAQVSTANVNHEYFEHYRYHHQHQQQQQQQQQQQHQNQQKDVEARQFSSGFNANAAFNSNFGSSNFGLNFGGPNNNPTSTALPQTFSNFNYNSKPSNPNNPNKPSNPNNPNSSITSTGFNSLNQNNNKKETNKNTYNDYNQKYPGTATVERFNHHYPDGSYEYRYELADGTARYERGYFLLYDNKKTLVVVGYYSYRMPDGRYITVFYNADQNGYRQNQSITPQNYPNLPRSIDVPQFRDASDNNDAYPRPTSSPSSRQTTTTTRRTG